MRIALIHSDARRDGTLFATGRELRRQGHDVTLLVPQAAERPEVPDWVAGWTAEGGAWLPVCAARQEPAQQHFPRDRWLAAARTLADVLATFDAAWFFEAEWALPALRHRRFADRRLPVIAVTHSGDPAVPASLADVNRTDARAYAHRWADPVGTVAELEALWRERTAAPSRVPRPAATSPALTICLPYYEAGAFLEEALAALERQTRQDFDVVVVDDGSPSEDGRAAFARCAARYADRGWTFITQTNQYPGAARNRAARDAQTEFLLFLDADDVATPTLVERLLRAALLTGDDCLTVPLYVFANDPHGPAVSLYDPPGALTGSMADDMHGGACILVRRAAFEQLGGFTTLQGVGYEDYEFHVRCELAGLRWDILPEWIFRYRQPRDGGVSRSTRLYANQTRVLNQYEQRLQGTGLEQLPRALAASHWRAEGIRGETGYWEGRLSGQRAAKPSAAPLRLLLAPCFFPFDMVSGWHQRVQALIRYFGSRHHLTLLVQMTREQLTPVRREAFAHLKAIRGVDFCARSGATDPGLPAVVRERYSETLREAMRALPTAHYHAVFLDQLFMAELRHDVETLPVLTEHNIESRLLHQAAEHHGQPPIDAQRLERYEDRVWPDFPLRAVVSETDRAQMLARVKTGRVVVAPNGADPSVWLAGARREANTLLFPAHLAYPPNVDAVLWLLDQIWPRLRRAKPQARLILAGRDPAPAVRTAVAQTEGAELVINPPSMDAVAARASAVVVPLRLGSGTRCKILEALAWGLPVVSTTLGAEGLHVADGEHLLLRDTPEAFADGAVQVLTDSALWQRLRESGAALVRERYSWDRVFAPLEEALLELVS